MASRLGQVIYWAGCVIAAVAIGLGILAASIRGGPDQIAIVAALFIAAVLAYLIGRGVLYVLAGR